MMRSLSGEYWFALGVLVGSLVTVLAQWAGTWLWR